MTDRNAMREKIHAFGAAVTAALTLAALVPSAPSALAGQEEPRPTAATASTGQELKRVTLEEAVARALAEEAIAIAREAVTVAEEDLRVVQQRYELGVATILEVITSQVALDEAAAGLVTARYDYLLAKAELEAILGREL